MGVIVFYVSDLCHFVCLVYNLWCKTYIGQTKHSLKLQYQEHNQYIKNNNPQSAYAKHILNNKYEYGSMHNTMELFKQINKIKFLIPYEQLYIQFHHR
jgi:hypothetical protein